MNIVEFLRARLDEDEAVARMAQADPWRVESDWTGMSDDSTLTTSESRTVFGCNHEHLHGDGRGIGVASRFEVDHIARHDPARVLREVEAKRRIVSTMQTAYDQAWQDGASRPFIEATAQRVLRALAAIYADHPDYNPEWR